MIKTTRDKIFNNHEYTRVTILFEKNESYVKNVIIEHNRKEIIQYHEGRGKGVFSSVTIMTKDPVSIKIITHILKRWKRKYEYEFEGIDFPDEESLCLFLMELAHEI